MMRFHRNHTINSEKGFTLLETIIAVTLVALMGVGVVSVFRTGTRSWTRGTGLIDSSQRQRVIQDLVRKQMASAFPLAAPVDENVSGVNYPLFKGTENSLQFISLNSLSFQESPGLTLVQYEVSENPENGAYTLIESEQPYVGQSLDSEEDIDLFNTLALFDNLSSCSFQYRSPDDLNISDPNITTQIEAGQWVNEWDAQELGQLPVAVAMTMELMDANGDTRRHNVVVPVYATEKYEATSSRSSSRSGISRLSGRGRGGGRGGGRTGEPGVDDGRGRGGRGDMSGRGDMPPGMGPGRGGRGMFPGMGPGRGGRGMFPGMGPGMGPGSQFNPGEGPGRGREQ